MEVVAVSSSRFLYSCFLLLQIRAIDSREARIFLGDKLRPLQNTIQKLFDFSDDNVRVDLAISAKSRLHHTIHFPGQRFRFFRGEKTLGICDFGDYPQTRPLTLVKSMQGHEVCLEIVVTTKPLDLD